MAVIPTTNVSLATIRDAINSAGGSATNDALTFFYKSNINIYSLEKPMSVKGVSGITNKNTALTDAEKKLCNYGYSLPDSSSIIELTQYIRDGVVPNTWVGSDLGFGWFYNPPTGGSSDPYRLSDFRGYNSLQTTAFTFTNDGGSYVNQLNNIFTVAGSFPFSKFSCFDGLYVGILFCKVGTSYTRGWFYVTNTLLSSSNSVDIELDEEYSTYLFKTIGGSSGTWKICPFLCSTPNVQSIITSKSNYISDVSPVRTIPVSIITATYKAESVDVEAPYQNITFRYSVTNVTSRQIVVKVTARNTGSAQTLSLSNIKYEVTMESQNVDDGQYVEIHSGTPPSDLFDTLSVSAGTSSSPSSTVLNDNMTISWTPRDGEDEMISPFYIDIYFYSFINSSSGSATHSFGTCRILYDNGWWEQT